MKFSISVLSSPKKIFDYCSSLENEKKYIISKQLLKSGTSIGANVREAPSPQSRADFISKMTIALKEANETEYWLELCEANQNYPNPAGLGPMILSIKKLLAKIVSSSKNNLRILESSYLRICKIAKAILHGPNN